MLLWEFRLVNAYHRMDTLLFRPMLVRFVVVVRVEDMLSNQYLRNVVVVPRRMPCVMSFQPMLVQEKVSMIAVDYE